MAIWNPLTWFSQQQKPAKKIDPLFDDGMALPHVMTFNQVIGSGWAYWHDRWDEAMRKSREDALAMRRDCSLMGPLNERKLAVASLGWHLEIPDERNIAQKLIRDEVTKIIKGIRGLRRIIWSLLDATWYGRYAVQLLWAWDQSQGRRVLTVKKWLPHNGDKIGHSYAGVPYILVNGGEDIPGAKYIQTTQYRGLELSGSWRERFILHTHEIEDADYWDAEMGERIHGVGIRDRVFFLDWIRKEWLGKITDFIDRVGLGVTVWYYNEGNPEEKSKVERAAREQSDRLNIVWPRSPHGKGNGSGIERLEVPVTGAQFLRDLQEYIDEKIERYIVGQTLSSKSEGSGLGGTGVADLHADTKSKIAAFDAANLGETLTGSDDEPGLVNTILRWSFPGIDFPINWVFDVEKSESKEKLEAGKVLVDSGVPVKMDEMRAVGGFSKPGPNDEIVQPPAPPPSPFGQPDPSGGARSSASGGPDQFRRTDAPFVYGRWLTIGAKDVGGEKKGGTPVYVENGRITKGHPKLTGKRIDALNGNQSSLPSGGKVEFVKHPKAGKDETVVMVDPKKLDEGWKKDGDYYLPTDRPGITEIGGRRDGFKRFLETGKAVEASRVFLDDDGTVSFDDGRHRFAVLRDGGAEMVGVTVNKSQAAEFERLFGEGEPDSHRKQLAQGKSYSRAVWAKKAKAEGIKPEHLHQLAGEVLAHDKEFKADLHSLQRRARDSYKSLAKYYGWQTKSIDNLATHAGRKGLDAASVKGLDAMADELAGEYPQWFSGHGEDLSGRLFELLAEGNPEPMAEDDAYQQAYDQLLEGVPAKSEDELVPFHRTELPFFYEQEYHGPNPPGEGWTQTAQGPRGGKIWQRRLAAAAGHSVEAFKHVGHQAVELEHAAKEWTTDRIESAVGRLPAKVQAMVKGAWHAVRLATKTAFVTYQAGQAAAEAVARENGASAEEARSLRAILSAVDIATLKPVQIGSALVAGPAVAGAVSFLPIGSLTYLAYSTAKNPLATLKAARRLVRKVAGRQAEDYGREQEQVGRLLAGLKAAKDRDWYSALVLSALDQTQGLADAMRLAGKLVSSRMNPEPYRRARSSASEGSWNDFLRGLKDACPELYEKFNEADHPRNQDGEFTKGSGTGKKQKKHDRSYQAKTSQALAGARSEEQPHGLDHKAAAKLLASTDHSAASNGKRWEHVSAVLTGGDWQSSESAWDHHGTLGGLMPAGSKLDAKFNGKAKLVEKEPIRKIEDWKNTGGARAFLVFVQGDGVYCYFGFPKFGGGDRDDFYQQDMSLKGAAKPFTDRAKPDLGSYTGGDAVKIMDAESMDDFHRPAAIKRFRENLGAVMAKVDWAGVEEQISQQEVAARERAKAEAKKTMTVAERVEGLSPEQRVEGLSPEQRKALIAHLAKLEGGGG